MPNVKINLSLLRRFLKLAKPYWWSNEKWTARGLVILLLLLMIAEAWFNVYLNEKTGELTSSLAARDAPRFWHAVRLYCASLTFAVVEYSYYYYVRDQLALRWRRWLTSRFLDRYLEHRAYYEVQKHASIDNPDQRIADDVATFTGRSLSFLLLFAGAALQLLAFSHVLWSISQTLVFFLAAYAVAGTWITLGVFGGRMVTLNFDQLIKEANFRFGLIRVRENAESIAFYGGEPREHARLSLQFGEIFNNLDKLIRWTLRLSFFQHSYSLFTWIVPSIVLAPRVLSGELEVGRVVEAAGAFAAILGALTLFVDNIDSLSRFAAGIDRLDAFSQVISHRPIAEVGHERIAVRHTDGFHFDKVTLQTPDYKQTLVRELTVSARPGEGLMIVGPSGCGKSSLLRALAGLWGAGSGSIERPKADEVLFIPQNAYMVPGNLRDQLCYPSVHHTVTDKELTATLEKVNLPGLIDRCGGLDAELDFDKILSVGERQRVAFARVLLQNPRYALLDEASSALDPENEAAIFKQLIATSTTLISVSHHKELVNYHFQVLELTTNGGWTLHSAAEFRAKQEIAQYQ